MQLHDHHARPDHYDDWQRNDNHEHNQHDDVDHDNRIALPMRLSHVLRNDAGRMHVHVLRVGLFHGIVGVFAINDNHV